MQRRRTCSETPHGPAGPALAALRWMVAEGRKRARLLTDDFRLAVIKTCLVLGFEPHRMHESHAGRRAEVFDRLGLSEWKERFLDGTGRTARETGEMKETV